LSKVIPVLFPLPRNGSRLIAERKNEYNYINTTTKLIPLQLEATAPELKCKNKVLIVVRILTQTLHVEYEVSVGILTSL